MPMAGAEAATAEEVLAGAVSTVAVSAAAGSTAVVVSVEDISAVALSAALAFVMAVFVGGTGVATGAIADSLMTSSSAATAIRDGTGAIRTGIMITAITRTVTMDTDTEGTPIATMDTVDTVMVAVMDTAMVAGQRISEVHGLGDKPRWIFEVSRLLVRT